MKVSDSYFKIPVTEYILKIVTSKPFLIISILYLLLCIVSCEEGKYGRDGDPGEFDFTFAKTDSNGVILQTKNGVRVYAETDSIFQQNPITVILKIDPAVFEGTITRATFEPLGLTMDSIRNDELFPGKTYMVRIPYNSNIYSDPNEPFENKVRTWVNVRYLKNGTDKEYETRSFWKNTTVIQPQTLDFSKTTTIVAQTQTNPVVNMLTDTVVFTDYFFSQHFFLDLHDQFGKSLQNVQSLTMLSFQSQILQANAPSTVVDSISFFHNPGKPTSEWNENVLFIRLSPTAGRTVIGVTYFMRVKYKPHPYAAYRSDDFQFTVLFKKPS